MTRARGRRGVRGWVLAACVLLGACQGDPADDSDLGLDITGGDGTATGAGSGTGGVTDDTDNPLEVEARVAVGEFHACGLTSTGRVACWGDDRMGQVSTTPAANEVFVRLAAGQVHTCALWADGQPWCWGDPQGDKFFDQVASAPAEEVLEEIWAGEFNTCGLRRDRTIVCWGANDKGQSKPPSGGGWRMLALGRDHGCALDELGDVTCWGSDRYGQATPPTGEPYTWIAAGDQYTCGARFNAKVICWGRDEAGRLAPPDEGYPAFDLGPHHGCGLRFDGSMECWGTPGIVVEYDVGLSTYFTGVGTGNDFVCGVTTADDIHCFGDNRFGQLNPPGPGGGRR